MQEEDQLIVHSSAQYKGVSLRHTVSVLQNAFFECSMSSKWFQMVQWITAMTLNTHTYYMYIELQPTFFPRLILGRQVFSA